MKSKKRHEVELKFKLGTYMRAMPQHRESIYSAGFKYVDCRIERDFLPDTTGDNLKRAKILLRLRQVTYKDKRTKIYLTLKKRRNAKGVLFFDEVETVIGNSTSQSNNELQHIVDIVYKATNIDMSNALHGSNGDFDRLVNNIQRLGFYKTRILLDKYREEYSAGNEKVVLDYFPDRMGLYAEVEAHSISKLEDVIRRLPFNKKTATTTDYGDLLKEYKSNLSDEASRRAVFTKKRIREILDLDV